MIHAGYVLVGGRSSRMGCDKALLPWRGGTLLESVACAVSLAAGSAVLVGTRQLYGHFGYPAIPDLYPGAGPLGAILTALHHTSADWNLAAACDMPELSAEFLRLLLRAAERSDAEALVAAGPSGRPEPLCAVYHRRSLPALERALKRGVRPVRAALESIHVAVFSVPELTPFQNVNTPRDWAAYASK
jgi:molybdopterin-guanine dinucleotide biosynthesis protein A